MQFEDYMYLWTKKDPKLIDKADLDKDQREAINNPCKWTAAILERLGDAIQRKEVIITPDQQYRLAIMMRSANNDCKKCKFD